MKRWPGKLFAGAVGAGALAALYAWRVERTRVSLEEFVVKVDKPGLPPQGLVILHISDLHCRLDGRIQQRKLSALRRVLEGKAYDILAVTGDFIHDAAGIPTALAFLESLRPRLAAFSCPGNHDYCESSMWGIFGTVEKDGPGESLPLWSRLTGAARNVEHFVRKLLSNQRVHLPIAYHDVDALHAALELRGIRPLVNQSTHLCTDGVDLWVAGVDDLWEGRPDMRAAVASVPEGALLVMLAHNPDSWLDPAARQADLILAGHVHGGQVRLPGLGAIHTQGTHLSRQRPHGWFRRGTTRMYVSRGVGESLPLRFGAQPQVALIHLLPT